MEISARHMFCWSTGLVDHYIKFYFQIHLCSVIQLGFKATLTLLNYIIKTVIINVFVQIMTRSDISKAADHSIYMNIGEHKASNYSFCKHLSPSVVVSTLLICDSSVVRDLKLFLDHGRA